MRFLQDGLNYHGNQVLNKSVGIRGANLRFHTLDMAPRSLSSFEHTTHWGTNRSDSSSLSETRHQRSASHRPSLAPVGRWGADGACQPRTPTVGPRLRTSTQKHPWSLFGVYFFRLRLKDTVFMLRHDIPSCCPVDAPKTPSTPSCLESLTKRYHPGAFWHHLYQIWDLWICTLLRINPPNVCRRSSYPERISTPLTGHWVDRV